MMLDRRVRGEIFINAGFAAVNIVGVLLSYSVAARVFTPIALDLLLLGRRVAAAAANLTQLGVSQTLQRYLSVHAADQHRKLGYLQQALLITFCSSIAVLIGSWLARGELSRLISPEMQNGRTFCIWLAVTIVATSSCFLSTSLLLAERRVIAAGLLQLLSINGFFLIGLWWFAEQAEVIGIFKLVSLCTLTISTTVALYYCYKWRHSFGIAGRTQRRQTAAEFFRYGSPRTLTSFLDAGMILLGPWLLRTHAGQAAAFLMALTALRMTQAALTPISQVLGLGAARMMGNQQEGQIGPQTRQLFGALLYLGVLTPCLLAPWSKVLVEIWLSNAEVAPTVTRYLTVLIWATTPLTLFYGLRGVVDMRWTFPLNLVALIVSLALQTSIYFAAYPLAGPSTAVSAGVVLGFWALGLSTVYWIRNDLRDWRAIGLIPVVPLGVVVWLANYWLASSPSLLSFFAGMLFSALCMLIVCKFKPPEFVRKITSSQREVSVKGPGLAAIAHLPTREMQA